MSKTFIYSLICPLTNNMVYIGKANSPSSRLKSHLQDLRGISVEKLLWLDEIKRKKLKPSIEILDEVNIEDWQYWEEFYIGYFKSLGIKLLNKGSKQGLTYSNEQSFKKNNKPWNYGLKLKK